MKKCLLLALSASMIMCLLSGCIVDKPDPTEPSYTPEQLEALEYLKGLTVQDDDRSEYNVGSCATLTEDVAVVVLLADDDASQWDAEAVENFTAQVNDAMEFICSSAAGYGVEISMPVYVYCTNQEQQIRYDGTVTTGGVALNALHRIAKNWGYEDQRAMHAALQEQLEMEQIAYIVATNKSAHSFAQAHTQRFDTYWLDLEYCVIDFLAGRDASGTIVHEFLHLFGAQDFYRKESETTVYNERRAALAESLCPNAIMLNNGQYLADAQISSFTAYTIGWLDTQPEEYNCDDWWVGSQWEDTYTP